MKRYLLTVVVTIIFTGIASPQTEFLNGYVIKNDGSYTYGQVAYISKGYSVNECLFRWFDISAEFTFKPGEIRAFGFSNGMRYKSVSSGKRGFFMACLTDGEVDLLYDGKQMYLDGAGIYLLPMDKGSGTAILDGKVVNYKGCMDLLEKLPDPGDNFNVPSNLPLSPERMAEVIAAYNSSQGADATILPMKNPGGIHEELRNLGLLASNYGFLAGLNASRYDAKNVGTVNSLFLPEMNFFEVIPMAGAFYNRPLNRNSDLLSLNLEVMAFRTNVYIYSETDRYSTITRSDINISYTGIKIPLSLRFTFLEGNYKPFVNAGGFAIVSLGGKYTREGEVENSMHVVRPFIDNSLTVNRTINGFLGGIGLKKEITPKQSLSLEFRAEYGTGIYDQDGLRQNTLSFNIIAAIDFF
jgi:hypothetical protein